METSGLSLSLLLLLLYIIVDVNYFIRCAFTILTQRIFVGNRRITDTTTIYGICTTQDVDIFFRHMNNARFLRDLNFASVHFYSMNDLYDMVIKRNGTIVQACTSLRYRRFIELFQIYKIDSKLVWWDQSALYFEQHFITLSDGFINAVVFSKHRLINCDVFELLESFPEAAERPEIPNDLKLWLESIEASSEKLQLGRSIVSD